MSTVARIQDLPDLLGDRRRQGTAAAEAGMSKRAMGRGTETDQDSESSPPPRRNSSFFFPGRWLLGCGLCAVDDDEFVRRGVVVEKIEWRGRCGAKVEEAIEQLEEMSDNGELDAQAAEASYGHGPAAPGSLSGGEAPRDSQLLAELDALRSQATELFLAHKWSIERVSGDRFIVNGRSAKLRLLPVAAPRQLWAHLLQAVGDPAVVERASRVQVSDGSLQQPLLDYMLCTGQNETYDQRGTENIAIVTGGGRLLDFNVAPTEDRILEMKSATIQADLRRSAGGEPFARVSALQSEGSKLLGAGRPGGQASMPPSGRSPGLPRCG